MDRRTGATRESCARTDDADAVSCHDAGVRAGNVSPKDLLTDIPAANPDVEAVSAFPDYEDHAFPCGLEQRQGVARIAQTRVTKTST